MWCQGPAKTSCARSYSSPCEPGAGGPASRAHGCTCVHVCARMSPPGPYLLMEKILLAKLGPLLFSLLPVLGLPHHRGLFHRSDGHFLCKTRAMATNPSGAGAQPTLVAVNMLAQGVTTLQSAIGGPGPGLPSLAPLAEAPPQGSFLHWLEVWCEVEGGDPRTEAEEPHIQAPSTHLPIGVDQDSPEAPACAPAVLTLPHKCRWGAVGHSCTSCPHLETHRRASRQCWLRSRYMCC